MLDLYDTPSLHTRRRYIDVTQLLHHMHVLTDGFNFCHFEISVLSFRIEKYCWLFTFERIRVGDLPSLNHVLGSSRWEEVIALRFGYSMLSFALWFVFRWLVVSVGTKFDAYYGQDVVGHWMCSC